MDLADRPIEGPRQATALVEAQGPAFWRETLAPYATPDVRRATIGLATSVLPYFALTALMYALFGVSPWLVAALTIPAAGFLVRTFIVFHDCTHGSYLPSRRANTWLGVACGVLVYSPFHAWRHEHAMHHATAGDLDRRGKGDVETLTVAEFAALSPAGRLGYRLMRNPLVLLGFGPLWALIIEPRFVPGWARERFGRTIVATDVAIFGLLGGLCALAGWQEVLLIQLVPPLVAGSIGIWLFYVQHQFEGVYWERKDRWSYAASALQGSSHLRLPKWLQWFTGNIGLHHVHHLSARIPNYNLQRAHDENPIFHDCRELDLRQAVHALHLKLYDERSGQLVGFRAVRA